VSWVFDATPLIYLAKAGQLEAIEALDEPRVIPEAVYREVVTTGVEQEYDDARRIERAVTDGALSTAESRDAIDAMIDHGWYVAPDVYTKTVGKLESFE